MLKVWGRANSSNLKKVTWLCEEIDLPYERIDAGMAFGVVNTPEYRKLNPNGLVPTIDDEGFILWESNAIVRYLAARHAAGTLWPTDLKVRSEEHTSELQSLRHLVCRLLLEKKKTQNCKLLQVQVEKKPTPVP